MATTKYQRIRVAVLIVVLACCVAVPSMADDIYVTITDDTNDGFCGGPLHFPCSLRDAIILANNMAGEDTIHVPPGNYRLTIGGAGEDFAATGDLNIRDNVTIYGSGAGVTIVDALANDRVFHIVFSNSWANFLDLTIRGGNSTTSPGSVNGAGILIDGGAVNLIRCIVEDNLTTTGAGGGVSNENSGAVFVRESIIRDNLAAHGSGIAAAYGTVLIENSTIEGNYLVGGSPSGGVVRAREADVTIKNSTICDNQTQIAGPPAGISLRDGQITIESCTLADNDGPEIFSEDGHAAAVTLSNTIIKGTCSGVYPQSNGGNVGDDYGNYCNFGTGDYWAVPISLHPLGDYGGPTPTMPPVYVLNDGNLSIDNAWADANCLPEDQQGNPRPLDGNGDGVATCDSGAVEVSYDTLPFLEGFESGDVGQWTSAVW